MANPKEKGSAYEREICGMLSLWWTKQEMDDCLWRTAGSGARARIRGRMGKETSNQHGDIQATHFCAQPLIDIFSIEVKKGYNEETILDVLDKPNEGVQQQYEVWIQKQIEAQKDSGSYSWLIIHARDRRKPLCFMPRKMLEEFRLGLAMPYPYAIISAPIISKYKDNSSNSQYEEILMMRLNDWMQIVKPHAVTELAHKVRPLVVDTTHPIEDFQYKP